MCQNKKKFFYNWSGAASPHSKNFCARTARFKKVFVSVYQVACYLTCWGSSAWFFVIFFRFPLFCNLFFSAFFRCGNYYNEFHPTFCLLTSTNIYQIVNDIKVQYNLNTLLIFNLFTRFRYLKNTAVPLWNQIYLLIHTIIDVLYALYQ